MAVDGSHDAKPSWYSRLSSPISTGSSRWTVAGYGPEARAVDPHPDHLRPGVDAVVRLDRGEHRRPGRDVRGARPDDVAQDGRDAVGAAHDEERLRRRAAVLEDRPRSARRRRTRRPSGCARTRAPRGRRWRRPRTAGPARGRPRSTRPVGRRAGDGPRAPAEDDGGHRAGTSADARRGGRRGVDAVASGAGPGERRERRRPRRVAARDAPPPRRAAPRTGPRSTPSSVMIPVMSSAGVTSNDGLRTSVSGGAMR